MSVKYFHPDIEHRKLKFLKTEDDSIAAVIKESYSVEVLGSYCTKQFTKIKKYPVFFKCSAPSVLTSTEDLGTDSDAEGVRHHSSISDRIDAGGGSDEFSSNNPIPTSKITTFSVLIHKPYDMNKTIKQRNIQLIKHMLQKMRINS